MSDDGLARAIGQLEGKLDMILSEQQRAMEFSRHRHEVIAKRFDAADDTTDRLTSDVASLKARLDITQPLAEKAYAWTSERETIERWLAVKWTGISTAVTAIGYWLWHMITNPKSGG